MAVRRTRMLVALACFAVIGMVVSAEIGVHKTIVDSITNAQNNKTDVLALDIKEESMAQEMKSTTEERRKERKESKTMIFSDPNAAAKHYLVFGPVIIICSIFIMACLVKLPRRAAYKNAPLYKRASTSDCERKRLAPLYDNFEEDSDEDELFCADEYKRHPKGFVYW